MSIKTVRHLYTDTRAGSSHACSIVVPIMSSLCVRTMKGRVVDWPKIYQGWERLSADGPIVPREKGWLAVPVKRKLDTSCCTVLPIRRPADDIHRHRASRLTVGVCYPWVRPSETSLMRNSEELALHREVRIFRLDLGLVDLFARVVFRPRSTCTRIRDRAKAARGCHPT